jgi:hypothetical protein
VAWRTLKRLGLAPQGSDVSGTTRGPDWANRTLGGLLGLEAAFLRGHRRRLPVGLSLVALAQRPLDAGRDEAGPRTRHGILQP